MLGYFVKSLMDKPPEEVAVQQEEKHVQRYQHGRDEGTRGGY